MDKGNWFVTMDWVGTCEVMQPRHRLQLQGDTPVAGPFTSEAAANEWASEHEED